MSDLTAIIAKALQDNLGWDWPGEDHGDVCSHGGPMRVPSAQEVIDDLARDVAAAIREAATITTVDQLDALPSLAVIRDNDGIVYELRDGYWRIPGALARWDSRDIAQPVQILWTPGGGDR